MLTIKFPEQTLVVDKSKALTVPLIREIYDHKIADDDSTANIIELPRGHDALVLILANKISTIKLTSDDEVWSWYHALNYFQVDMKLFIQMTRLYVNNRHHNTLATFLRSKNVTKTNPNIMAMMMRPLPTEAAIVTASRNDWAWICYQNYPEAFFNANFRRLNWHSLSRNTNLSEAFFEQHIHDVNWTNLSGNPAVSEEFLTRYKSNVNWRQVSMRPNLSDEFIDAHINDLDWQLLSGAKPVRESVLNRHEDKVVWTAIDWYTGQFSEEFLERHFTKIDWEELCFNDLINESFFERHISHVVWVSLCRNESISEDFFNRHLGLIPDEAMLMLLRNENITPEFFEKKHIIDWESLSLNFGLTEEFIERHSHQVSWDNISLNHNLSEQFWERNLHHANWTNLSQNHNLTLGFYIRHWDRVDKSVIGSNPMRQTHEFSFLK